MTRPRTVVTIQARMGSSRLPGKVLADVAGRPMLQRVIERTATARRVDAVVVATTDSPADDPIANLCKSLGVACHRGSEHDVLGRILGAARAMGADIVVRVTADCPLLDGALIDECVEALGGVKEGSGAWDFTCNRLPPPWKRTYPIGLDVECCWRSVLERAAIEAELPHQREHVMPYIYENAKLSSRCADQTTDFGSTGNLFNVLVLNLGEDLGGVRWTVDVPEDLEVVRGIYAVVGTQPTVPWRYVLEALRSRPDLLRLNATVSQRAVTVTDERSGIK